MKYFEIDIRVPYENAGIEKKEYQPKLCAYILNPLKIVDRPAIVICPGGGYKGTSDREAEAIALQYMAMGYHAFVLRYSCAPDVWPTALLELAYSVDYVRKHAKEWHILEDKIIIEGFSAGGHLVQSLATFWNQEFVYGPLGLSKEDIKPNAAILCYPVITSGEFAHRGSFNNLLAGCPDELLALTSLENQAGPSNPPTFIWHTYEDQAVPVENSLLLAVNLRKYNVPLELHIFPKGCHGLSLATKETGDKEELIIPSVQPWVSLSHTWIESL